MTVDNDLAHENVLQCNELTQITGQSDSSTHAVNTGMSHTLHNIAVVHCATSPCQRRTAQWLSVQDTIVPWTQDLDNQFHCGKFLVRPVTMNGVPNTEQGTVMVGHMCTRQSKINEPLGSCCQPESRTIS